MPTAQSMTLTAFEWFFIVTALGGFGYMLTRFVKSQDKNSDSMNDLAIAIKDLRSWVSENHVTKIDHRFSIDALRTDIQRELSVYRETCPYKKEQ